MYKAHTLTHMLFYEQKIFPDFFCKYRLSLNRIFVCNETFTIYAQYITNYEYLKNIFEYYSDFENWPRISVTFFFDHSVYIHRVRSIYLDRSVLIGIVILVGLYSIRLLHGQPFAGRASVWRVNFLHERTVACVKSGMMELSSGS